MAHVGWGIADLVYNPISQCNLLRLVCRSLDNVEICEKEPRDPVFSDPAYTGPRRAPRDVMSRMTRALRSDAVLHTTLKSHARRLKYTLNTALDEQDLDTLCYITLCLLAMVDILYEYTHECTDKVLADVLMPDFKEHLELLFFGDDGHSALTPFQIVIHVVGTRMHARATATACSRCNRAFLEDAGRECTRQRIWLGHQKVWAGGQRHLEPRTVRASVKLAVIPANDAVLVAWNLLESVVYVL